MRISIDPPFLLRAECHVPPLRPSLSPQGSPFSPFNPTSAVMKFSEEDVPTSVLLPFLPFDLSRFGVPGDALLLTSPPLEEETPSRRMAFYRVLSVLFLLRRPPLGTHPLPPSPR